MRPIPKLCFQCNKKRAKWPIVDPCFCSKTCAANRALEAMMGKHWCTKHGDWWDSREEEGCFDCMHEQRANEDRGAL